VDLSGANLRGADLRKANLHQATLRGADLTGANLRDADFTQADLLGAILTDTERSQTRFDYAIGLSPEDAQQVQEDWSLGGIPCEFTLERTDIQRRRLQARRDRLQTTRTCSYCDLVGADLSGLDLSHGNLKGADLRAANLRGTDLREANVSGVNLDPLPMLGVDDLCLYATLIPDLTQTNLSRANLTDIRASPSLFTESDMTGAIAPPEFLAQVERDRNLARLRTTGQCPGCDLQGVDFTAQSLSLAGANLRGANLSHAVVYREYSSTQRSWPDAVDLRGADLREANLTGAQLSPESGLDGAILCRTTLPDGSSSDRDCR
jgi:uncharacterized protein YjbI with pentapeptide repeats